MPVSKMKPSNYEPPARKAVRIRQTVFIPAPPEKVYAAYLDGKKHSAMTGGQAEFDPHEGGDFTAWDGYISGTILELEKGKKIVQDWITTEWPEGYPRSVLTLSFKPKEKGTELEMVQECVPASQAKDYEQGWHNFYWKPMQKYFSASKKKAPAAGSAAKKTARKK